jgi:hypothetical protein
MIEALAPERLFPARFQAYVRESPSGSDAIAVKLKVTRSATPNAGVTVTLAITGARLA